MTTILITGGCGFIGSNLAVSLAQAGHNVVTLDNLARRGSERLRERVLEHGCKAIHGDIRSPEDLDRIKDSIDVLIECSAEPSVLVGAQGADARFMINNNLNGSVNCFEFARIRRIPVLFMSTSRVYPYNTLNRCTFSEEATRFELAAQQPGITFNGVSTETPLAGIRSLYGATKLSSELLLQEYSAQYDLPAIINRCGVIAGPWQLGKVDQGVFTHWLAAHYFKRPLNYIGFGGHGKQVRDLLHIHDLTTLITRQIDKIHDFRGEIFNAGGSRVANLSLLETTEICRNLTGHSPQIGSIPDTRPADLKWYITDNGPTESTFNWQPKKAPVDILSDTFNWLHEHEATFRTLFA